VGEQEEEDLQEDQQDYMALAAAEMRQQILQLDQTVLQILAVAAEDLGIQVITEMAEMVVLEL
jgi:hypothetical protein